MSRSMDHNHYVSNRGQEKYKTHFDVSYSTIQVKVILLLATLHHSITLVPLAQSSLGLGIVRAQRCAPQ